MEEHKVNMSNSTHVEDSSHEAALTGAVALAALFSTCVEAFGLVHPTAQKWDKVEQRQLARLGLQQARLLAWGTVVGITSPPKSVTDRAVPKHPSGAYPDLAEPTFFTPRDPRLDEPATRTFIEQTLSALVDRSTATGQQSREEMMARYGLRPPKKFSPYLARALDPNRLEAFRERHDLLREVAESYAHLNTHVSTPRANSLVHTNWEIADVAKFSAFVTLTREKVDLLVSRLQIQDAVDRAVRMDIRAFGWHLLPDHSRLALDISKLRLLHEVCLPENDDYPQYLSAVEQALENISREQRENAMKDSVVRRQVLADAAGVKTTGALDHLRRPSSSSNQQQQHHTAKRPGFLKIFRSFGKSRGRASSLGTGDEFEVTPRSKSDSGPSSSFSPAAASPTSTAATTNFGVDKHSAVVSADAERYDSHQEPLQRIRSKSVGSWDDDENEGIFGSLGSTSTFPDRETFSQRLRDSARAEDVQGQSRVAASARDRGHIIRHDQYHGLGRVNTSDLHQADY